MASLLTPDCTLMDWLRKFLPWIGPFVLEAFQSVLFLLLSDVHLSLFSFTSSKKLLLMTNKLRLGESNPFPGATLGPVAFYSCRFKENPT